MGSGDVDKMMQEIYNDPSYKKTLKLWLPFLNKQGILDAVEKKDESTTRKRSLSFAKFKKHEN